LINVSNPSILRLRDFLKLTGASNDVKDLDTGSGKYRPAGFDSLIDAAGS
jgi:hypothetical protein